MKKEFSNALLADIDFVFEELDSVQTIIKITKEVCFEKENNSKYYNLPISESSKLSNERNNYINLLSLALEKIDNLMIRNEALGAKISNYNITPTIAADK